MNDKSTMAAGLEANRNALAEAITANTPVSGSAGEGTVPPPSDVPAPADDAPEGDAA